MKPDHAESNGDSTGKFSPSIGILSTALQTLGIVGGKFQYQFLENADELLHHLKERCSPEDYEHIAGCFELLLKQPIRRTLGRIRCVTRSLEEVKRNFEAATPDAPKNK